MFSRVGRLTTFGAQAVSNCPFRRDNIYQQPLKVTAPINDQIANFAHNFSDSLRPRTTSFGNDPFFGVAMDDEEVIKELELLDLDSWHSKPRAPCPAPSDSLELDQFWEGKNVTLEAWRPTDTWQMHGNGPSGTHQTTSHTSGSEMMHDFSNFGDNMGSPLFQSEKKPSKIEENTLKVPKFEMDVENASKTVDWEAWNHYLDCDDDIKRPEMFFTTPEEPAHLLEAPMEVAPPPPPPPPPRAIFKIGPTARFMHHDVDLFSSGPLLCVPKQEEVFKMEAEDVDDNDEDYFPIERRNSPRMRKSTSSRRREESERSWTPASDEFAFEEKTSKFKKRGVVLKPHVDEETDRRRALNRIAAVRYREKKRAEKMGRKREFQDVIDRNRILLQKERQLKRDITAMKKELRKLGAIIH